MGSAFPNLPGPQVRIVRHMETRSCVNTIPNDECTSMSQVLDPSVMLRRTIIIRRSLSMYILLGDPNDVGIVSYDHWHIFNIREIKGHDISTHYAPQHQV